MISVLGIFAIIVHGLVVNFMQDTVIGPIGAQILEQRAISVSLAESYGLYTGRFQDDGVTADIDGGIIVFPYFQDERVVAEKYRTADKKLWQRKGGRKTFWNAPILDAGELRDGTKPEPLIISEGELDSLSAIACGFPFAVSVPLGAPNVPQGMEPDELEPLDAEEENSGRFEFLWNNRERLRSIKKFIIAVDNDGPGQRLAAELVRRLLAARCLFVVYPDGCKDLNDVLVKHGQGAVRKVIRGAKPYPVKGLYYLNQYPEKGKLETFTTGWRFLDRVIGTDQIQFKLFMGEFMVVTGIPSHGKSRWALNLLYNLATHHGWRSAIFSPEMPTVPHLRGVLRKIISGAPDNTDWSQTDEWIRDKFVFIDNDPSGGSDDELTLEWVLQRAAEAVLRDGIRVLLIDPWNEIEHARGRNEAVTDYIGRSIRSLKRFAKLYEVVVIVIAHPTKDIREKGAIRIPHPYDIEGSAHWFNKADHAITIYRGDFSNNITSIFVQKSRFEEAGIRGQVDVKYDPYSCRFGELSGLT